MPITIGSNIAALQAQRRLNEGSATLSRVYERLASGQRINRASDDAAGLAVSARLQSDARVYGQAMRNANDGLSLLSIAEGALKELSNISTRIMELAEQSANGTYGATQRSVIDDEAQALSAEFSRVLASTKFNGRALFSASTTDVTLQVGASSDAAARLQVLIEAPLGRVVGDGTLSLGGTLVSPAGTAAMFTIADINNDGRNDLFYSSSGSQNGYLLGNGDGTFKSAVTIVSGYTHGGNENAVLRDLNADGNLDIIYGSGAGGLVVMLGNGNATFKTAVSYATGGADANGPDMADFNGDGALDVAVVAADLQDVRILLGNGNGTFKAAVSLVNPGSPRHTAVGDVNGDGRIDIIASGENQVYLGNGNGTFSLGVTLDDVGSNRGLKLLDFNNDGFLDTLTADFNSLSFGVRLGNGNGTFKAGVSYAAGDMAGNDDSSNAIDINGDGYFDVVVASYDVDALSVFINNGNGTFKASVSYAVNNPFAASVGDVNGDGVDDVVTGDYNTNIRLYFTNTTQSGGLPIFSLRTASGARSALDSVRGTLDTISSTLGKLGAYQSRITTAVNGIMVARENYIAAASRITDADIATESAELTRVQILQQAASAVLSQANQQPALALRLLSG